MIIGITGTNGAGKGTIVSFLKNRGFEHYSVRSYLEDILVKEGKNTKREDMINLANELREVNGPQYVIEQLYNQAQKSGRYSVIESLRCPGEITFLQKYDEFYMFSVDASRLKRYNRIVERNSNTDNVSFKEFVKQEMKEFNNKDSFKQNLKKCISMSDYKFRNNGSIPNLYKQLEKIIRILHR